LFILHRSSFIICLVAVVVLTAAALYRPQSYGVWADQMTYYLQANSLAFDGDLQFDQRDLERFRRHGWAEKRPYGLFLREANGRFFYSKPFLYSLLAVPFVWVAPVRGLIVLNSVLWLILLWITFSWYRRFNSAPQAATIAALAWIGSAAPFYIFIIHTDLMIPTLLAAALFFWLTSPIGPHAQSEIRNPKSEIENPKSKTQNWRIAFSGILFGLAMYEKNPFVFFFAAAWVALITRRQWRGASAFLGTALVAFALPTLVHVAQDGHVSPYWGRRIYCDVTFPFDNLDQARAEISKRDKQTGQTFQERLIGDLVSPNRIRRFVAELPTKTFCLLVGRKTGLFPYLAPALIALALWLALRQWRAEEKASLWIAAALAAYFLFYFYALRAYYGGSTAIGNRYALQVFPAFLLLVRRLPRPRAAFTAVAGLLLAGGLFFPGPDLLCPYGKVRDNFELFLKPRFRWLPFEWHLTHFVCDKPPLLITVGKVVRILPLSLLNPTYSHKAYFVGSARHEVAILSYLPSDTFPIRLTARTKPQAGWLASGRNRVAFSLAPYESAVFRVPLTLRDRATFAGFDVYSYPLEIITTPSLGDNEIYPKRYYRRLGAFVHWVADERPATATVTVVPDDPRDVGRLLWGWHAPEPPDERGLCRRWAGEARESAVLMPVKGRRDYVLRATADCPVVMETEVVWNGRTLGTWRIAPGQESYSQPISAADVREGDNILCLRHKNLWEPPAAPGADGNVVVRQLAVHYRRFSLEY
jgi:multisubunit Na+/H+ antiporter MnhG subunit